MYQFLSYLRFIFSATNQHGVHSPFVYDYVTKCLYKKNKIQLPITQKILVKSILYFDSKKVKLMAENENTVKIIKANCPTVSFTNNNPNIIFGNINEFQSSNIFNHQLENSAILLVDDIHKNKRNLIHWEQLKTNNQIRVTIDLFYCGVVFFRKEQVKEHFKIRI